MTMRDAKGVTVACREAGEGAPVVLLHSSASSSAQWSRLAERLRAGYRVSALDLYGCGGTDPWPGHGPLTLAAEAELVRAVLNDCTQPVHLVGHSYGGAVALTTALAEAERLASLTLIEPVAFHLLKGQHLPGALFAEVAAVAERLSDAVASGDYRSGMAGFVDYWNGAGTWARLSPARQAVLGRAAIKVASEFSAAFAATTALADYARIEVPTLLLVGATSPAPTRRIASMLRVSLPGAALSEIAGAGHMAPLTHADAVNAAIANHIAATRRPAGGIMPDPFRGPPFATTVAVSRRPIEPPAQVA